MEDQSIWEYKPPLDFTIDASHYILEWDSPIYDDTDLPPIPHLLFVLADSVDTIELSTDVIDQLSTEQQTFFTGASWSTFALFWSAVSAEDWFNDQNIIGSLDKGVWIGEVTTSRYTLNNVLVWFGLPPILVYAFNPDEEIMIGPDETQVEVI